MLWQTQTLPNSVLNIQTLPKCVQNINTLPNTVLKYSHFAKLWPKHSDFHQPAESVLPNSPLRPYFKICRKCHLFSKYSLDQISGSRGKKCTKQGTSYEIGVDGLASRSVQVVFLLHLLQVCLLLLSVQLLESLVRLVVQDHQIPGHKDCTRILPPSLLHTCCTHWIQKGGRKHFWRRKCPRRWRKLSLSSRGCCLPWSAGLRHIFQRCRTFKSWMKRTDSEKENLHLLCSDLVGQIPHIEHPVHLRWEPHIGARSVHCHLGQYFLTTLKIQNTVFFSQKSGKFL